MVETTRELSPISNETFDDFLKEQGIFEHCNEWAIKEILAEKIQQGMAEKGLSKAAMAKAMQTSRHQLNNLLDPKNPSLTFHSLQKAANVLGKQLNISLG